MNVLKIKSKDFQMELSMDENGVTELKSNGVAAADNDIEMALIALALNQYGESFIHDEETDVITIVNSSTEWSSKSFGLNNSRGINLLKKQKTN
ncbi:MAG: hypothetical protein PHU66_11060 [Bacteroidaceae bacterium]|nr:hypothetical protein [Bacteroidaceae bacterium]